MKNVQMKATAKHTAQITYSICACIHYVRYAGSLYPGFNI